MTNPIHYLHGFGNHFQSESLEGVLVPGRNSPQNSLDCVRNN